MAPPRETIGFRANGPGPPPYRPAPPPSSARWVQGPCGGWDRGPGPPVAVVREPADLHNLSQDSGLSHSPIFPCESPQLTIGSPIKHIETAKNGREKGGRWSISGFFKRKSAKFSGSENDLHLGGAENGAGLKGKKVRSPGTKLTHNVGSSTMGTDTPPPLPPKRSNSCGRSASSGSRPGIFPHLKPDYLYPEPDPQLHGFYYHPSFGYVKAGSYYDQQISNWNLAQECVSSQSSGVDSDITGSLDLALRELDRKLEFSSDEERRSRQGSQPTGVYKRSSSESRASVRSSQYGSTGSKRSRSARTERYAQRRSKLEPGQGTGVSRAEDSMDTPVNSPYIYTAHVQQSLLQSQPINTQAPPPPPQRDCRRRLVMPSTQSRPFSYSFETIVVPGDGEQADQRGSKPEPIQNQLPLPPRKPLGNRLSLSDQHLWESPLYFERKQSSQANQPPRRGDIFVPEASSPSPAPLYIDTEPRSRKPIQLFSSESDIHLDDGRAEVLSADDFWAPHQQRLSSPTESFPDNSSERNIKTPNRDSAIVSNISTPLPNCDSQSVSSIEKSGKSSPTSVSSKDSGCPEPKNGTLMMDPVMVQEEEEETILREEVSTSDADTLPGFSTKKKRSQFREAIAELETVCMDMNKDDDLLDRAERRDLPTAHQELIWKGREVSGDTTSHDTSDCAFSDIDNILNWNTSSSFENISGTPGRPRTPGYRRSGVTDKVLDDMVVRKITSANKVPTTTSNSFGLSCPSYLVISPLEQGNEPPRLTGHQTEEPDIRTDDLVFRNHRDVNAGNITDPQPKFGIPVGPVTGGANSDYLHAVPEGKYRSTFHPMRNHDVVKDDLAFRNLRKDSNQTDPQHLGIVKDPNGIILPRRAWPYHQDPRSSPLIFYPNRHSKALRSLSEGITELIKKQSAKPAAEMTDLISYYDIEDTAAYDCMRYSLEKLNDETRKTSSKTAQKDRKSKRRSSSLGRTVFDLLRYQSDEESESDECSLNSLTNLTNKSQSETRCEHGDTDARDKFKNNGDHCVSIEKEEGSIDAGNAEDGDIDHSKADNHVDIEDNVESDVTENEEICETGGQADTDNDIQEVEKNRSSLTHVVSYTGTLPTCTDKPGERDHIQREDLIEAGAEIVCDEELTGNDTSDDSKVAGDAVEERLNAGGEPEKVTNNSNADRSEARERTRTEPRKESVIGAAAQALRRDQKLTDLTEDDLILPGV